MAPAAQSFASQFGLSAVGVIGAASLRYDFRDTDHGLDEHFIDANGLRGTTARSIERNLQGNRPCSGRVRMQPTAVEWASLLEWMMGGSPTGSPTVTYPLADTRPVRSCVIDRVTKVFTYATTAVAGWTLSGKQDAPLDLVLDLISLDESVGNAGTFPALTLDVTTFPFKFTDCVLSLNSGAQSSKEFRLTCDYHVDRDRFFNSQTLTGIYMRDRTIMLGFALPYCDSAALYDVGRGGYPVVITATVGGSVLTMTMVKVANPRKTPPVPERDEIMLPQQGQAFRSGSTNELVVSLNATP